jgi:NAD(P)H-dependent flavin oxidoreductase YrpB (nitropropane dioxygenase family)
MCRRAASYGSTNVARPVYGERDVVDSAKMREIGLPFWLAGGIGSPDGLDAAIAAGSAGIQVGTLFAYCEESRCSAEPVDAYVAKGGDAADTVGRRCLCNGLTANIGQAQWRPATNTEEIPLVTSGDDLFSLVDFATNPGYTAHQVVRYLCRR